MMRPSEISLRFAYDARNPDLRPFDIAERKGVGHPDTMADGIADAFSRAYSQLTLDRFGMIANHWVDKVNLVGAGAAVAVGSYEIRKPIGAYLFGKVTAAVGAATIDIQELFEQVVLQHLVMSTSDLQIADHVRFHVDNTAGRAMDHAVSFYEPASIAALSTAAGERVANDTSACVATSYLSLAGQLAVCLDDSASQLSSTLSGIGSDFKTMVVRDRDLFNVTVAVPVHPGAVTNWSAYEELVAEATGMLRSTAEDFLEAQSTRWRISNFATNTKDSPGRGYLAPFGTSLGKGDCGAVGRGNRYLGAIEPLGPSSAEAPAGKNPVHHIGKVYTWSANALASRIFTELGFYAEVGVVSDNGSPLSRPSMCAVALEPGADRIVGLEQAIATIWVSVLDSISEMTELFVSGESPGKPSQVYAATEL